MLFHDKLVVGVNVTFNSPWPLIAKPVPTLTPPSVEADAVGNAYVGKFAIAEFT